VKPKTEQLTTETNKADESPIPEAVTPDDADAADSQVSNPNTSTSTTSANQKPTPAVKPKPAQNTPNESNTEPSTGPDTFKRGDTDTQLPAYTP
jgi:hypothetical protein